MHWWELLVRWSGPTPFTLNWFLVHSFVPIAKLQFLTWNNNSSIPSPQFVEILFVTIVQDLHWTLANPDLLTFKKFEFKKSKVNYPVAASLEVWKLFSELKLSRGHNPVTELTLWVSKSLRMYVGRRYSEILLDFRPKIVIIKESWYILRLRKKNAIGVIQ